VTGYALCTTPFSGGSELCALLTQSGGAGSPRACFEPGEYERASARWGTRDFDAYVAHLWAEAAQQGGVLGFEIHWHTFADVFATRDARKIFPGLKVVLVRRRDRLAQALRWSLAEQVERGASAPLLDVERVRTLLARIHAEEGAWTALFEQAPLSALPVWREDLVQFPDVELRRVLHALGFPAPERAATALEEPDAQDAARLADWRERYLSLAQVPPVAPPAPRGLLRRLAGHRPEPAPAPAPRSYAFELAEHNLPERIPAGWTRGARVTLRNTGNFAWRAQPFGAEGRFERGEIALTVRHDGEWVSTHKLSRYEVAPGQAVTIHFALVAPEQPGRRRLTLDLIEWEVAHFQDKGQVAPEHWFEVEKPSSRRSSQVQRLARRVNPWHFAPSGGVLEDSAGHLYPNFIARAKGCKVWDVEGREYLDYTMGGASALLGHAEPRVLDAIRRTMEDVGPLTQLPHPLESEVSRMLCEEFPCAEMVTFGKNGSDVCTVVARLARAFTGKRHILYRGYHGWQDFWAEQPGYADAAIPARPEPFMHPFRFGDREDFTRLYERWKDDLAAVMVEPSAWCGDQLGYAVDAPEFLAFLAEAAREAGALLVFDECFTALRHPQGSAQKATGIVPDLACAAKALASGMPLAAAMGRADVLRTCMGRIFYPGPTYRGEAYSLAAAKATLEICRREPVAERVNDYGRRLKEGIDRLCRELGVRGACAGPTFRPVFVFHDEDLPRFRLQRTLFVQELLRHGILTNLGVMVPSYAHDDAALARTLEVVGGALETVAEGLRRDDLAQRIEIPPVYF